MRKLLLLFLLPFYLLSEESLWVEMTKQDVLSIYKELHTNSPGPIDSQNSTWKQKLETGKQEALEKAELASSFFGYQAILKELVGRFDDPHVALLPELAPTQLSWPGFVISYENDAFVVSYVDKSFSKGSSKLPSVGDLVLEIDGLPVKEVLDARTLKYLPIDPDLESSITRSAPDLLLHETNPFEKRPASCLIDSSSRLKELSLQWEPLAFCRKGPLKAAAIGKVQQEYGMRDFLGKKGAWINIPSFQPELQKSISALQNIVSSAKNLRDKEVLVIDLRGNSGGNSGWGSEFLEGLFGKAFFEARVKQAEAKNYEEFRVSKDNLQFIEKEMIPMVQEHLGETSILQSLRNLATAMKNNLDAGKNGLIRSTPIYPLSELSTPLPLFNGTLILITDNLCSSSALTFISQALAMPNTLHFGRETGYTTAYTEVRSASLPSKLFKLVLPMKVLRGRGKDFNGVFVPKYIFMGSITDTVALEAWIKQTYLDSQKEIKEEASST